MARARNIKPGFFKNEDLAELAYEYRLLFIGLWTMADREGYLEDRPKRIKMELFPADNVDVETGLAQLQKLGFIHRYTVGESRFLCVCNFLEHQHPHHLETASTIPKPETNLGQDSDKTRANPSDSLIPDSLIPDSKDMSGKPDAGPSRQEMRSQAVAIISFLNEKTGRNYQPVDANVTPLLARFKEGFSPTVARQVVAKKAREWGSNEKMEPYLRPATLFNKTNFANYAGEIVQ